MKLGSNNRSTGFEAYPTELTEYAAQSTSDSHADAAKPMSILIYSQQSLQKSVDLSSVCLTPIPETSGFAFIDKLDW